MNPLCISRLIESGFHVSMPIGHDDIVLITRSFDEPWQRCLCQNASSDGESNPIFRVPDPPELSIVCEEQTRTVWLLPVSIMQERTVLRLGKRYEEFIIPEPLSLSSDEQKSSRIERMKSLRDRAREIAEEKGD